MEDIICNEKLQTLGVSCAEIRVEITSIKEVLNKQMDSHIELIRLVERQEAMLAIVKKNQKENDELFKSIRKLEKVQARERLDLLEKNQRKFVYTSLSLCVAAATGAVIKVIGL